MDPQYKEMTSFLVDLGIEQVGHTEKTYLGHLIAVHRDLDSWGCGQDVCRAGMFHSIYGTERFQGFTLPIERRGEVRELIGDRAEFLAYLNCAMDRTSFDAAARTSSERYEFADRLTHAPVELNETDFDDLGRIHLCDWIEQVGRAQAWGYRHEAYRQLANRLGGIARESYERAFAGSAPGS